MSTAERLAEALEKALRAMDIARDAIQPLTRAQIRLHNINPQTDVVLDRAAAEATAALAAYRSTPADGGGQGVTPLTDEQIEKGREAIFSTSNPFCPCDSKTMRKAVRWAERAHRIGTPASTGGEHAD